MKNEYGSKIRRITKKLRESYYKTGTEEERQVPLEPNQLTAKQGLGNFPAFYLEGHHCERSDCGNCTNCFYSQFYSEEPTKEQIQAQYDYVLKHFEELVLKEQYGKNEFPQDSLFYQDAKPIFMTFSPTGSFFSEKEFPRELRIDFLRKLKEKSSQLQRDIILHIESHANDVVKAETNLLQGEEIELLRKLHAKCILGFESVNEWSRNVLYNKRLPLKEFEKAVTILQRAGIEVGAFVFSGLMTHTDTEAKQDMLSSVKYLKELGVFPVLMFANCQSWTIPDLLIQAGEAKLQEPYTVLDTVYEAMNILTKNGKAEAGYYLVPEPVDGPPYPEKNIFFDRDDLEGISSVECMLAHEILVNFRATRDIETFQKAWETFTKTHPSYTHYLERMRRQESSKLPLQTRLEKIIEVVVNHFEHYVEQRTQKDKEERQEERETYKGHVDKE